MQIFSSLIYRSLMFISISIFVGNSDVTAANVEFNDVSTLNPNYDAIHFLVEAGIINGYPDGSFKTFDQVNRVETLKIIMLASSISPNSENLNNLFFDTPPDEWYAGLLSKAIELNIIEGYPDGSFKPDQTINLVEALKIMIEANEIDLNGLKVERNPYADNGTDLWYSAYLQYANNWELIDADENNLIHPNRPINREKLAVIMYRMIKANRELMPIQKRRAEQIISIFENGITEIQYAFTINLDDGRGITAGRAGFTTATGDVLEVIKRYTEKKPNNLLAEYLPVLEELSTNRSDDTSELEGFEDDWREAARDAIFRNTQDEVVDDFYFLPAMDHADQLGLRYPLSRAVIYDTIIQHGGGVDPDGLKAIINQTNNNLGGSPADGLEETKWLMQFLDNRIEVLTNAHNEATREKWALSAGRCLVFKQMLENGNYYLKGPIIIDTANYKGFIS